MRVLVCGGRGFTDPDAVWSALDALHGHRPITAIIQGGAAGADTWAAGWAFEHRTECLCFAPDRKLHGKDAVPMRNRQMITQGKPDLVMALPGGKDAADMVGRARGVGIEVATLKRVI